MTQFTWWTLCHPFLFLGWNFSHKIKRKIRDWMDEKQIVVLQKHKSDVTPFVSAFHTVKASTQPDISPLLLSSALLLLLLWFRSSFNKQVMPAWLWGHFLSLTQSSHPWTFMGVGGSASHVANSRQRYKGDAYINACSFSLWGLKTSHRKEDSWWNAFIF